MSEPLEPSVCAQCGHSIETNEAVCAHCWTPVTVAARIPSPRRIAPSEAPFTSAQAKSVAQRYRTAYSVAASMIVHGVRLKRLAFILGALIAILALFLGGGALEESGGFTKGPMILVLLAAVVIGANLYTKGIRIIAEGQLLLASLDVAVNTSHFLTDKERASVMRL